MRGDHLGAGGRLFRSLKRGSTEFRGYPPKYVRKAQKRLKSDFESYYDLVDWEDREDILGEYGKLSEQFSLYDAAGLHPAEIPKMVEAAAELGKKLEDSYNERQSVRKNLKEQYQKLVEANREGKLGKFPKGKKVLIEFSNVMERYDNKSAPRPEAYKALASAGEVLRKLGG